ncbi:MAG TPA: sulfite exporter TauE/SafE family protein [Kofleriaceae bacterium]|nr:sulfite exporter TauE/SafE family protein [Kofleriaceae bacterium]
MSLLLIALLALAAGFLTTVSGMGGGMMLVIVLSLVWGPHVALPVTAAALLVGNLHRLALYRRHLRMDVARPLVLGLVPGAAAGALLVAALPAGPIHAVMLAMVLLALGRAALGWTWQVPRAALGPAGAGIGVMAATSGGAAVLTSPLLLASGLEPDEYLATVSLAATAMHVARIIGYGAGGLVGAGTLAWAALLAALLVAGNLLGRAARSHLAPRTKRGLEYGALAAGAAVSIAGIG